jgi:hypothetical protein
MGNAPITFFRGHNVPPDLREQFKNWRFEAYIPILLKIPGLERVEYYQIIKENPLYPYFLGIFHYSELPDRLKRSDSPDWHAVMEDQAKTFSRVEPFWSKHYLFLRNFDNVSNPAFPEPKTDDAPIIKIEAFKLSPDQTERYNEWFVKWAYRVYIPVLLMLPGFKEYIHYQKSEYDAAVLHKITGLPIVTEYPRYVSVLHFANQESCENYENSPALIER